MAFFPCIFFSCLSQMAMRMDNKNYRRLPDHKKVAAILERVENREVFYKRFCKLQAICIEKGIRLIIENPWALDTYLKTNHLKQPDVIDENRMLRGDYFIKPTAYWFWNCTPTQGFTYQNDKPKKEVMWCKKAPKAGLCSEERSMISPDYARNFICDFILGRRQPEIDPQLFD